MNMFSLSKPGHALRRSSVLSSIFYKESIKTFPMALGLFFLNTCFMIWNFVVLRQLFILDHSEVVWYRVMNLGQIPYQDLMFIPLMSAIAFCLFQFLEEMRDARIRISLHLPCDSSSIVLFHAFFGLVFLSLLFSFDIIALLVMLRYYFPSEICFSAFVTTLPWFLAGLFAYLGGTFVLLEPQIKRKSLGVVITFIICLELLSFHSTAYYENIIYVYFILLPCMFYSIAVSADDYRNRWA